MELLYMLVQTSTRLTGRQAQSGKKKEATGEEVEALHFHQQHHQTSNLDCGLSINHSWLTNLPFIFFFFFFYKFYLFI